MHPDRAWGSKEELCLPAASVCPSLCVRGAATALGCSAAQHTLYISKSLALTPVSFPYVGFWWLQNSFPHPGGSRRAAVLRCSVPRLQTVMGTGSSQPGSADGNLNSQQYCSTGQNYILMTDLLHKQGKGVVTEILSTWRSSYVFIHGKLLSKVE